MHTVESEYVHSILAIKSMANIGIFISVVCFYTTGIVYIPNIESPQLPGNVGASRAGQQRNWKKLKENIIRAREAKPIVGHPSQGGNHAI